jgi:hypothetical protein
MSPAQIAARKALYRKIRGLSASRAEQVLEFIDDLEGHEPNEETIRVLKDSEDGRNLLGPYDTLEDMFKDFGIDVDAQPDCSFQK